MSEPIWPPDHGLPHDQLAAVGKIADAFTELLNAVPAPTIEAFLERPEIHSQTQTFSPAQWSALMYFLVHEVFEFLGRGGKIVVDDYEQRFPNFAAVVRATVNEIRTGQSSVLMAPPPAQPGQILGGRYELESLISDKGASAEVWLGLVQSTLGRVAIKLAREDKKPLVEGEIPAWRLVTELNCPNVVKFIDCGKTDKGQPYLVMEFIPGDTSARRGRTLSDWVKSRTEIDFKVCCEMMASVADTVHHVHEQRVLHLDIKPDNILLNHRDQPFLSDFGLARPMTDGRVTLSSFRGSPAYAAPELRLTGGVMTPRSDVFSLAAVLFELVAGVKPFMVPGDFSGDSAARHRELRRLMELGSVNKLPDGVPDAITKIIRRGLDKTPDRRFATAEELARALREADAVCGIEANAPPPFSSLPTFATPRFWEPPLLFERIDSLFDDYHHVALCGQPGLGKTLLSSEYAHRREKKYRYRMFAQATTDETLVTQLGRPEIARQLGLAIETGESPQSIAARVRDRLSQLSSWLLVFDDVPDTDADFQRVRQWLPSTERGGRVLISTPRETTGREVGGLYKVVPIQEWLPKDAQRFLLKALDQLPDDDLDHADPAVRADAEALVQELGCRPLALESAVQYMTGGRVRASLREYLKLWRNQPRKLADKGSSNPTSHASEGATFDLLWQSIRNESPVAANLIRLTAFLAHAPVPVIVLQKYSASNHGHNADSLEWRESFAVALRMLRQANDDPVTLHSLHRTLIRNELTHDESRFWLNAATKSLAVAFPDSTDRSQWSRCDAILPHVDRLLNQLESIDDQNAAACLLGMAATFRYRQVLEEKSPDSRIGFEEEELYRYALERAPNVAKFVGIFSLFLREVRAKLDSVEEMCQNLLEMRHNGAKFCEDVANFLTWVRQVQDEKEKRYRHALELAPNDANLIGNFALFLWEVRHQHDEAEKLYRRALELVPNDANVVGNFALFLWEVRHQHDEAEKLYRRALELVPNEASLVDTFARFQMARAQLQVFELLPFGDGVCL